MHQRNKRVRAGKEAARVKMRAAFYLRQLKRIAEEAKTAPPSDIPAMRLRADIFTRILNKCLPDLKAIEHSGEVKRAVVSAKPLTVEEWEAENRLGAATGATSLPN